MIELAGSGGAAQSDPESDFDGSGGSDANYSDSIPFALFLILLVLFEALSITLHQKPKGRP